MTHVPPISVENWRAFVEKSLREDVYVENRSGGEEAANRWPKGARAMANGASAPWRRAALGIKLCACFLDMIGSIAFEQTPRSERIRAPERRSRDATFGKLTNSPPREQKRTQGPKQALKGLIEAAL